MRVHEMIALLQIYIHTRKDVEVQIAIPKDRNALLLMIKAHGYAKKWLSSHNFKIVEE